MAALMPAAMAESPLEKLRDEKSLPEYQTGD
jgi:hypothetical protein